MQNQIAQAKKELNQLIEIVNKNRQATNDAELRDLKVDSVQPLKIKHRRTLRGHLAKVYAISWASDSKQIVSASQDGNLIVWNALNGYKTHVIPLRNHWVMTCAYAPSNNLVACGGLDNLCSIYSIKQSQASTAKAVGELAGHGGYISCCKFFSDKHMLTSSGDATCILWDINMNQDLIKFRDHTADVMTIAINPDGHTFVSGGCDFTAKNWDARSGKCTQTFLGHQSDINAIQFFPNGLCFATGSDDGTCRLFDIRADRELNVYKTDNKEGVTSIAFSKSGKYLFSAHEETKKVIVWDTVKGQKVQEICEHDNRISSLGVSPDGMALCTASWDTTLKIWA